MKMNIDTPKTNAFLMRGDEFRDRDELIDLARDFERELNAAAAEIERLRARNKRLEEALIRLLQHLPPVYMIADEPDTETLYAAALERARAALED
ncbi:MAG: hypothetical protein IT364_11715 [Candidatus Hydrogenedentes bacterium]|nr:hypothetical protein [Candidatus Hydrogenedentota bacterium]